MISALEIGLGSYVTHEDKFGGYDTHMVVDQQFDTFEILIHNLDGSRAFRVVPLAAILGVGRTPSEAAVMKDRELAARRREAAKL